MVGKWWIGYLNVSSGGGGGGGGGGVTKELFVVGLPSSIQPPASSGGGGEVKTLFREGPYWDLTYPSRPYPPRLLSQLAPNDGQKQAVEDILTSFENKQSTVALLHGPPKTGKSTVVDLLAKRLAEDPGVKEARICRYWKPWEPNDSLFSVHSKTDASEDKPLILVLEEFDIALQKIINGTAGVNNNRHLQTAVKDKSDWNTMLDEIDRGKFPHLILILTSNRHPDTFEDSSFLRDGRVDLKIQLDETCR